MNRSSASSTWPAALAIAIAVAPVLTSDYPALARDRQPAIDLLVYDRAEQQARARLDSARHASGDVSMDAAAAADEVVRALLLNGRGWSSETRRLSEETVRIKEGLLGPNHADLAPSLINLGDVLTAAAEYDRAIAVLHRAVGVLERAGDSPTMALAEALDHLGASLTAARQNDAAFRALERSLRMKEGAAAAATVGLARTLEAIVFVAQNAGDYQRSGVAIRRAQEIQRAADPDHPAYVDTLNLVAQQLWFEGRLAESKDASERALALAERTLRPEHPTLALYHPIPGSHAGRSRRSLTITRAQGTCAPHRRARVRSGSLRNSGPAQQRWHGGPGARRVQDRHDSGSSASPKSSCHGWGRDTTGSRRHASTSRSQKRAWAISRRRVASTAARSRPGRRPSERITRSWRVR